MALVGISVSVARTVDPSMYFTVPLGTPPPPGMAETVGALVAKLYAAKYPDEVAGMVIVDHAFMVGRPILPSANTPSNAAPPFLSVLPKDPVMFQPQSLTLSETLRNCPPSITSSIVGELAARLLEDYAEKC